MVILLVKEFEHLELCVLWNGNSSDKVNVHSVEEDSARLHILLISFFTKLVVLLYNKVPSNKIYN